jgi:hypothetical protein
MGRVVDVGRLVNPPNSTSKHPSDVVCYPQTKVASKHGNRLSAAQLVRSKSLIIRLFEVVVLGKFQMRKPVKRIKFHEVCSNARLCREIPNVSDTKAKGKVKGSRTSTKPDAYLWARFQRVRWQP